MQNIFITGGTGYIGSRLIKSLQKQGGFRIKALIRKGSEHKAPACCEIVSGNALEAISYQQHIERGSSFIHLVGVAHPSPSKKEAFKQIDLVSVQQAVKAAKYAGVNHFIYLSVSQYPSGIMRDYQLVRAEGETLLKESGIISTFIRPWYVLGPGHRWPVLLMPLYGIAKLFPSAREKAEKHGLVTINQMIETLVYSVQNPPAANDVYEVEDIKTIRPQKLLVRPVIQ